MHRFVVLVGCLVSVLASFQHPSSAQIYWTEGSSIHRAEVNGSAAQTLITLSNSFPLGIVVDTTRGKIYWVNYFTSRFLLQRANLDGSGLENLMPMAPASGLGWGRPHSIAIDETGAGSGGIPKLYLGETDTEHIKRVNLNGTGLEVIVSGLPNDSYIHGIDLDPIHQKVYWAACCPDSGAPSISRANVDGSDLEEIALNLDPWGLALDAFTRKVYWASRDTQAIWRANLDGSQRESIVAKAGDYFPLALNRALGKIYWADPTNLWQANLDGSNRELLVPGDQRINGIAVYSGAPQQSLEFLSLTSVWKYNQSAIDLGTAWKAPAYDDSVWPSGAGVFGLEDNPAVTPLIHTPLVLETNGVRTVTYYFRAHFQVSSLNPEYLPSLKYLIDDGAVFYLNGVEILRVNMPSGPIDWQTRANIPIGGNLEGKLGVGNASASPLVLGDNVLAVEVHQSDLSSTDIVFGSSLYYAPQLPLHIDVQPRNEADRLGGRPSFSAKISGSFPRYQWFKDGVAIPTATNDTYLITSLQQTHAGHYYVVATNNISSVTSQVATLTVLLDQPLNPFVLISAQPASDGRGGLIVIFTHNLEGTSALDPANYQIARVDSGQVIPILGIETYGPSAVRLFPGTLETGNNYTLTVNNVRSTLGPIIPPNSRVAIPTTVALFSFDSDWKYNDSGADLGVDWRAADFNDSTWSSGPGLLYNDENFTPPTGTTTKTLIAVTNVAGERIVTHYFRKHFALPALPAIGTGFSVRYVVDDGAIFYLNGQEFARFNMPSGLVNASTRASASATEGVIGGLLSLGTNLVVGDNVLAVEVHQFSLSSPNFPDISFGMSADVKADSFANTAPMILRQPADATAAERDAVSFFTDVLAATQLQWLRNGVPIPGANSRTLNISRAAVADNGAGFSLIASNSFGSVTGGVARLYVVPDFEPPQLRGANMGTNIAQVTVTFSEFLDPASAEDISRYSIRNERGEPLAIMSASLTNGTNVVLATEPRNGIHFGLTVNGVADTAASLNRVYDQCPVGYEILHMPWNWIWHYDDTPSDHGTAWREPGYDDSVWPQGPGLLGCEDASLPEPIRTIMPPPEYRGPVYYFRTHIPFTPNPNADAVWLRYLADDGVVLFVNGVEVHRIGVPADQNYQTLATRNVEAFVEGPYEIPLGVFLPGGNLFAAELHQVTATSADAVFGAQLTEAFDVQPLRPVHPRLHYTRSAGQIVLSWDRLDYVLECSPTVSGPWQRAPNPTIPYTVNPSSSMRFYRLDR